MNSILLPGKTIQSTQHPQASSWTQYGNVYPTAQPSNLLGAPWIKQHPEHQAIPGTSTHRPRRSACSPNNQLGCNQSINDVSSHPRIIWDPQSAPRGNQPSLDALSSELLDAVRTSQPGCTKSPRCPLDPASPSIQPAPNQWANTTISMPAAPKLAPITIPPFNGAPRSVDYSTA